MTRYRQIPRETEMLRLLIQGHVDMSPLKLVKAKREPSCKRQPKTSTADAIIQFGWGRKVYRFAVECKAASTPKEIAAVIETSKRNGTSFTVLSNGIGPVPLPGAVSTP